LMQLTYMTATQDAEKKNDESLADSKPTQATNTNQVSLSKITALAEPEIKFASKPSVPFDQLKIKSSFSLNDVKSFAKEPSPSETVTALVAAPPLNNKEVSEEDVKAFITKYIEEKQKQGARQIATIFKTASLKYNSPLIELTIQNETQREQISAIKQEFIDELRLTLQNHQINLNILLSEQDLKIKAYKPIDVFKSMAERNPSLLELKKRFDLEIDY